MTEAQRLNAAIEAASPALGNLLSPLGRRAAFPADIPFQAAQARGKELNATIGQITDGAGGALPLPSLADGLAALEDSRRNRALLYSPVEGLPELREAWSRWQRRLADPSPPPSATTLPVVTVGLTHGLSLVAEGLDWDEGDNVVGARCEYPSNVYPWMHLERRGVEYRMAPERSGRIDLEELESLVDSRTRVLALSWVQYANGFRADLERLGRFCRDRDVLFVVDVIQGLGALELDVEASFVDAAAGAAHKWLLGPEGVGLLYVSDRVVERIRPVTTGWRSVEGLFDWTRFDLTWNDGALRFEPGTLNVYGLAALEKSLEMLLALGPDRIERRILDLSGRLAEGLRERGFDVVSSRRDAEASGIVTATHPERSAESLYEHLLARGVVTAHRAGRLRISPHFYNTEEEVGRFFRALDSP